MEKDFDRLNYYELLDIKPDATAMEIRSAYNTALQMYQADSLVSYSFFSPEERKKILSLIERAYFTLINEVRREEYDNELVQTGVISSDQKSIAVKKVPVKIFDIDRHRDSSGRIKYSNAELKVKVSQNERIREIISRQKISGSDLREIRKELGVAIEKIHQETKIRLDYLNYIEENKREKLPATVFLKGFIKAYLKSLCINSVDEISERYINSINRQKLT
ncbi:MAG: helix-turn-helix domain-containing protein [Syntrophaceae bacterium]|nr:helix-turn-helix domain-containing protein [Syntrophaceae bacterium]